MYICKYCLRNLKKRYDTCPGCGASQFEEVKDFREKVIKDPPFGGYKIDFVNYEHEQGVGKVFKYIGYLIVLVIIFFAIFFVDFSYDMALLGLELVMLLFFLGLAIFFICDGNSRIKKSKKEIEKVKNLSKNGMLIKNLEYEIVTIGSNVNEPVYKIRVYYKNQSGIKVPFISDVKYGTALTGSTGTADLLVNPNDFSEYYIDFEIY